MHHLGLTLSAAVISNVSVTLKLGAVAGSDSMALAGFEILWITTYSGSDTVKGGDGDDRLLGGVGIDTLTRGAGADSFRMGGPGGLGDLITDMETGGDTVLLRARLVDRALALGTVEAAAFHLDAAVGIVGQFVYRAGDLIWDGNGTDAGGEVLLARFGDLASLVAGDHRLRRGPRVSTSARPWPGRPPKNLMAARPTTANLPPIVHPRHLPAKPVAPGALPCP